MKKTFILIFGLCLLSCSRTINHTDNGLSSITAKQTDNKDFQTYNSDFIDKSNFKFGSLDKFDLHDWYYGARQKNLKTLSKDDVTKYFQSSELKADIENKENNFYFFSIQLDTPEKTIITIIEEYDLCCADLVYLTYDNNKKIIGKSVVAGTGGDGEWYYNEYGKFTSDSTYQMTRVDVEQINRKTDKDIYQIDSLIIKYSVDMNFNFTKTDEKSYRYNKE